MLKENKTGILKSVLSLIMIISLVCCSIFALGINSFAASVGDVNGDGIVNSSDVSVLRTYLVNFDYIEGKSTVTVSSGADINGDGVINGKDLIRLRKFIKE